MHANLSNNFNQKSGYGFEFDDCDSIEGFEFDLTYFHYFHTIREIVD